MVEMPDYTLDGEDGPARLAEVFDGKRQLIVYNHMWFIGKEWQCPGCTGFTSQFTRLEFLDDYDARFVIVTQGPIDEALAYKQRVGNRMPWYSTANSPFGTDVGAPPDGGFAVNVFLRDGDTVYRTWHTTGRGTEQLSHSFALIDLLPYGRQEEWQDSPRAGPSPPRTADGQGPRTSPRSTAPRTPSVDRRTAQCVCPLPAGCLTVSGSNFFPVGPIWMDVSICGHTPQSKHGVHRQSSTSVSSRASCQSSQSQSLSRPESRWSQGRTSSYVFSRVVYQSTSTPNAAASSRRSASSGRRRSARASRRSGRRPRRPRG